MEPFSLYFNFYLGQARLTFMCMCQDHVDSSLSTQTIFTNFMESADSMRLGGDLSKQMPGDKQSLQQYMEEGCGKATDLECGTGYYVLLLCTETAAALSAN